MTLWHYTCSHSIDSILSVCGALRPNPKPGIQPLATAAAYAAGLDVVVRALPVVWLTDVDVRTWSDVVRIGLKGDFAECNRVEYRFRVAENPDIQPWSAWADVHLADDPQFRALLELECEPEHWWVSGRRLWNCRLDRAYVPPAAGR